MSATLDRIIDEARALPLAEQRQLRDELDRLVTAPTESELEDQFERQLVERGLLSAVPPPITDFSPYKNYKPIEVSGQPISEMIIEERR